MQTYLKSYILIDINIGIDQDHIIRKEGEITSIEISILVVSQIKKIIQAIILKR